MSQPVILLGHAGNYADIVDLIEDLRDAGDLRYEVLGFLEDREEMQGRSFHGYPVGSFDKGSDNTQAHDKAARDIQDAFAKAQVKVLQVVSDSRRSGRRHRREP